MRKKKKKMMIMNKKQKKKEEEEKKKKKKKKKKVYQRPVGHQTCNTSEQHFTLHSVHACIRGRPKGDNVSFPSRRPTRRSVFMT